MFEITERDKKSAELKEQFFKCRTFFTVLSAHRDLSSMFADRQIFLPKDFRLRKAANKHFVPLEMTEKKKSLEMTVPI